ncbi:hypothetical protein Cpap_1456 [Ruminiclostridium papyrosolvens DSM 2782]|uniref:Uncharacterized protein n=1 Tax=Ruminiclostridium papyrosolvens DSM 2782 TaxID=588581 RepID=F1TE98_9FIRM|nr:hypothetical protein [Ruminiclostridium papyrosolvens]EGD47064.1 hypothetical protein Cpap_1456 [Ruminiclostridium papyrosolvens DSM 2782]WES36005.1 hypothetical protein P0092_08605 [Ruminiclostridium papyrosolvens DSM 2782]WES36103.1 hypothetical protein P0092_09105 [Ruminiclostridium papyrosolvens DSM 2782]
MLTIKIKELKEVLHCDEANLLLNRGWVLLDVTINANIVYMMGRPENVEY